MIYTFVWIYLSLSFRKYLIATWALRNKFLKCSKADTKKRKSVTKIPPTVKKSIQDQELLQTTPLIIQEKPLGCTFVEQKDKRKVNKTNIMCSICGRTFTRSYDLKRHSSIHFNLELFVNEEKSEVIDLQNIEDLQGSASKTISSFSCEFCSRVFRFKENLKRHNRVHTDERPYQCLQCSKRFRDSGALLRHSNDVHAKIRNYQCDICNKWFVNRPTLEDHIRTHTGERPFVCHKCGVMFKSKSALFQHNKIHSDYMPHTCVYCRKRFRRNQELLTHITTHTKEKAHICEKCGKAFNTRSSLRRHIIIHSDEKPFPCLLCGLNFSQKRYLNNHMKSRHMTTADNLVLQELS